MTSFEDTLWRHLVAEHGVDETEFPAQETCRRVRPFAAMTAGAAGLAAAASAALLVLGGTAGAPPAYALTRHPDGTVTVTIHNLETAVPALNAKFKQMGIDETVIPVKPGCTTRGIIPYPGATPTEKLTFGPGHKYLYPGWDGVLAAEQLRDGRVGLTIGANKPPLPSCFSPKPLNPYRASP